MAQRRALATRSVAFCLASILAMPFAFDDDMTVLAPAIAFFTPTGGRAFSAPGTKTALAALWLMPLVARSSAQITRFPICVPPMPALFILLLRRSKLSFRFPVAFSGMFLLK